MLDKMSSEMWKIWQNQLCYAKLRSQKYDVQVRLSKDENVQIRLMLKNTMFDSVW